MTPTFMDALRELWCWIAHAKHHVRKPIYHSYEVRCTKCRSGWTEFD